jgi:hypothetical protein
MMKVLISALCAILSSAVAAQAAMVVVTYDDVTYDLTANLGDIGGNAQLLTSQVWYGNPAIADAFATAWFDQVGGDYDKLLIRPDFVTSIFSMNWAEHWDGVTLGQENGNIYPAPSVVAGYGGDWGDFVTALVVPAPSVSPVGEPATYGLFAGAISVCLVAWRGRRSSRRPQQA